MAGPTFGFSSLAADRGVQVDTTNDPMAYLGIVDNSGSVDADIQNSNGNSLLYYLDDNVGVFSSSDMITADVVAFDGSPTGLNATVEPASGSNDYVVSVSCGSSNLNAQGTATVDIVADGAARVELQRTTVNQIDVNCRGGGNPGSGFNSVSASDVSGFVQPGDERQTFSFVLAGNRKPNEQIEIDLSDARDNGINYDQTFWDGDVRIESGQGSVWTSGDSIVYQVSSQDKRGGEIVISAGSYATDGNGGPYEASFTRVDTGEIGTDQFQIDGPAGGGDPFLDVTAEGVPPNAGSSGERQTFRFEPGQQITAYEEVRIDLSEAQGNGVDYTWDTRVETGSGSVWRSGETLVYQVDPNDYAGEEIVVSIALADTAASGGPYDVAFTRTDTGDMGTDAFEIG
ncbi:hypothetical protein [Natrinema caseinilyticum]|uniref:hypothetical protein n=1 Tax=Natrinema caseinilyticum TaxID=2961570 RepID=UPI0020C387B0|nr:hypothetical protein [Natrinema caseinilyticum]